MQNQVLNEHASTQRIEEILANHGSFAWICRGFSMRPLIHAKRDVVYIRTVDRPLCPLDIVLYRRQHGAAGEKQYVLHRIMQSDGDVCYILGDNTVNLERVPKSDILGIMTGLYRNGKEYDLRSLRYRLYLKFWIRPWKLRVPLLRLKLVFKRLFWKFVGVVSPHLPRSLKDAVKKRLGW